MPSWRLQEVVADKGYHSTPVLQQLEAVGLPEYISEPDRSRRKWRDDVRSGDTVYANRRRNRGRRGLRLHRGRGVRAEQPFAHLYRTGRMRRTHLPGHENILKRLLVHRGAFNLGPLMWHSLGVGTPRGLQGRLRALFILLTRFWHLLIALSKLPGYSNHPYTAPATLGSVSKGGPVEAAESALATGC